MIKTVTNFLVAVTLGFTAIGQEMLMEISDTAQKEVLTLDQFLGIVMKSHPVMKQSDLQTGYGEAELRIAKGAFDPKLYTNYDLKNFDEKEYYNMLNSTLKIPTWFPVDPKITFDRNTGEFLDESSAIPEANNFNQIGAGLSLPVGRGLFIDERRMMVKQAVSFQQIARAEQIKIANKILLTAIKDYWNWFLAYQEILLLQQSVDIAQELFERVLIDYDFGEAAVVDTVQAKITYQTRLADYQQVNFDFIQSGLSLSVHLWDENLFPLELRENVIPDTLANFGSIPTDSTIATMIDYALNFHPEIQKLQAKVEQLEVENRWNRETLKPQVDLSYTFIDAPLNPQGELVSPEWNDNYKFGLDFYFPIFLRKERGKIQKTSLKIEETELQRMQTGLEIQNSIKAKFNEILVQQELQRQFLAMANNYQILLRAELLNLQTGESDLFKLNIQQDKFIESQIKYLKSLTKFQKSKAELLYEAGVPYLSLTR